MDLQTLQQECLACQRCGLCQTRTNVVFGQGAPNAEVLFVGEGPGASEDEQGLPFVGRSGQLLDHYLEAIDLSREKNVYIANIVKCRPPQGVHPLAAPAVPDLAAAHRGLSGAHRRTADDRAGVFDHPGTRQVF